MKIKHLSMLMALALALFPSISQAKYSGGSSSSHSYSSHSYSYSGGSSHSSSWGGSSYGGGSSYTKTASAPSYSYSKPSAPAPSYSYSKPTTASHYVSTGSSATSSGTSFNRAGSFAVSSSNYKNLNSYSSKYSQPPSHLSSSYYSSPGYTSVMHTYGNANGYYTHRQTDILPYYSRYPEPQYVYHMRPNYGIWDGYFMYLLMANAMQPSYSSWAYSNANNSDYIQWHQDMATQAQSNAQVATQLAQLDAQVAALKAQNAPMAAAGSYPVPASVAVSPSAVAQNVTVPDDGPGFYGWLLRLIVLAAIAVGGVLIIRKLFFAPKTVVSWN